MAPGPDGYDAAIKLKVTLLFVLPTRKGSFFGFFGRLAATVGQR
jgi:hypothetical protein